MTFSIFIYYDTTNQKSALRLANKYVKNGFKLTEESNCYKLEKVI